MFDSADCSYICRGEGGLGCVFILYLTVLKPSASAGEIPVATTSLYDNPAKVAVAVTAGTVETGRVAMLGALNGTRCAVTESLATAGRMLGSLVA